MKDGTSSRHSAAEPSIEVFFDGACPLCRREIAWLQRRDSAGRVRFTDIAATDSVDRLGDRTLDELMAELHARDAQGRWFRGVEAFRRLYDALGFKRMVTLSRLPVISHVLEFSYRLFARNRLRLTGRCGDSCSRESNEEHLCSSRRGDAGSPL